jgi:hypothetical protein
MYRLNPIISWRCVNGDVALQGVAVDGQAAIKDPEWCGDAEEGPVQDYKMKVLESPEIRCGDVENLLGEYADGELPMTLKSRLDAHIHKCSFCADAKNDYLKTIELARGLNDHPVPTEVQNRLRSRLNAVLGLQLRMIPDE